MTATNPEWEDSNNFAMRTSIEDGECYVHVAELIAWLKDQKDCPAHQIAEHLREASQLWTIAYEEGLG